MRLGVAMLFLALLTTPAAHASPRAVRIAGRPSVRQWYSLSCEYAAAAAVTLYWGHLVLRSTFLQKAPEDPNPHYGFRGNITGAIGGDAADGVYAEALVPVLARRGYRAVAFSGDPARLKAELGAGNPVVVWIISRPAYRPVYTRTYDGESFRLVPGEHTVVAYGYETPGWISWTWAPAATITRRGPHFYAAGATLTIWRCSSRPDGSR